MPPQPITVDGEAGWELERIIKHRKHHRVTQHLVKYLGYDMSKAMWLDEGDLENAQELLATYKSAAGLPRD